MTIVSKDEEQWWTARNSLGQTGSIPVPYVVKVRDILFFLLCDCTNFDFKMSTVGIYIMSCIYSTMKITLMVQREMEHHHARQTQYLRTKCGLSGALTHPTKVVELIIMPNNKTKPQTYRLVQQIVTNSNGSIWWSAQFHIDEIYFTSIFSENFQPTLVSNRQGFLMPMIEQHYA